MPSSSGQTTSAPSAPNSKAVSLGWNHIQESLQNTIPRARAASRAYYGMSYRLDKHETDFTFLERVVSGEDGEQRRTLLATLWDADKRETLKRFKTNLTKVVNESIAEAVCKAAPETCDQADWTLKFLVKSAETSLAEDTDAILSPLEFRSYAHSRS